MTNEITILATALAIFIFLSIFIYLLITSIIDYKKAINKYLKEVVTNEELEKINKNLRQQLDCRTKILRVEQVNLQPIELHYRLQFDMLPVSNIPDDMKKRQLYKGLGNELTEELEKRPDLCKISTTENYEHMHQCVDAKIRILPYID